jgi:hypothetical protein
MAPLGRLPFRRERYPSSAGPPAPHTHPPGDIIPQGAGSTLDADRLDGLSSADFLRVTKIKAGTPAGARPGTAFTTPSAAAVILLVVLRNLALEPVAAGPAVDQVVTAGSNITTGRTVQAGESFFVVYVEA